MEAFLSVLGVIGLVILVIAVFNLMILVHELGHYWAALWRGLKVDRFQIWFGKPLMKFTHKGVQWGLGWLPLGGFVALPQMAPMESIEGTNSEKRVLPPITPLDKIIVAFAGPLFSLLLAVFFAVIVMVVGHPPLTGGGTEVGAVVPGGPAAKAGLMPMDKVVAVDGEAVEFFSGPLRSLQDKVQLSTDENVVLTVERPGEGSLDLTMGFDQAKTAWWQRSEPRQLGILPVEHARIGSVMEYSPAAVAGIEPGDEIVAINGEKIFSYAALSLSMAGGEAAELLVRRADGSEFETTLAARKPDEPKDFDRELIGIMWAPVEITAEDVHPTVGEQISVAGTTIFRTLRALTSSKSGVGVKDLAGPVGIGNAYYTLFKIENGWKLVLWFSVLLNVNLAILNLLPLPVLDGGHITLSVIEWIRRKPVSQKFLEPIYTACALLLFGFMAYKILQESWLLGSGAEGGGAQAQQQEVKFYPPDENQNSEKSAGGVTNQL